MDPSFTRRAFLASGVCAAASAGLRATPAGKSAPRVVLISLDGIRTDGLRQAKTPHLDALFAEGSFSWRTRDVMPSITLPNWTSILTGSGPEQHGVTDNAWAPDYNRIVPMVVDAEGYYPSLFQALKEQVPSMRTAFYWNWRPLINPYNRKWFDETFYEENDRFSESYAKAFAFLKAHRDEPTLVFLYDVHTDHAGHRHAWMSQRYLTAIGEVDAAVGRLVADLRREGLFEGTHFLFLTDHGGLGNNHGGVSVAEMVVPWGIVGPGIRRDPDLAVPNNTINTAPTVLRLFGATAPTCWVGHAVEEVFGK